MKRSTKKMRSTGNDIVSLAATNKTRTKLYGFYSKILSQKEAELYETDYSKLSFENYIWLLWSLKEAAFKYLKRSLPALVFSPTKFVLAQLQIPSDHILKAFGGTQIESNEFCKEIFFEGTITYGLYMLYSRSLMYDDVITSVVNGKKDFNDIGWGIKLINNSDRELQSAEIREFLGNKLKSLLKIDEVTFYKSPAGIPIVSNGNGQLPIAISFSHHGCFVAYSYNMECEEPSKK